MSTHPYPHATVSLDEPVEAILVDVDDDDAEPEAASRPPYATSSR